MMRISVPFPGDEGILQKVYEFMIRHSVMALVLALTLPVYAIAENGNSTPSGTLLIAGNGPERHLFVALAQEFEKVYPSVSIDLFWHPNAKPIRTIELDEADIGVTGEEVPKLRSTIVARDGIAILTNFSNPIKEMTTKEVADVFSGKIRFWSEVYEEAPETKILLINRANNQKYPTRVREIVKNQNVSHDLLGLKDRNVMQLML